jgi:hypothetical protein
MPTLDAHQCGTIAALQEYFNALGVSKVSDLPDGVGSPPTDDPQVFLGYSGMLPSYRRTGLSPYYIYHIPATLVPTILI